MSQRDDANGGLSGAYRAVWRWHFYAGLFVLPVLCLLALTGGLYLFRPELESAVYRDLVQVEARERTVSADRWIRSAEDGLGGTVAAITIPQRDDRAAQLLVRTPEGERTAFVDRADGRLIGSIEGDGFMGTIKRLHSLELLGRPFNILVEIVAGWAVILVATGVFLWWPRRRDVAVAVPRAGDPKRRPFWRDLHAVTGLYAGLVVAFLAVTGMPWSAVWGDRFLNLMRESGLGRPPAPEATGGFAHAGHADDPAGTGWTLEGAVLPSPNAGPEPSLALVLSTVQGHSLHPPYTVSIPEDRSLAWTVSRETQKAEEARSLYIDPTTGAVIGDLRWSQFGVGAKAFEWGIAVHQGLQYGWTNRVVMLLGCISVWLLAVSGTVMWWKRRPRRGGLGASPPPPGPRARAAVLGIVLPLAVLYPLTGLSLLAAIAFDRASAGLRRRRPV